MEEKIKEMIKEYEELKLLCETQIEKYENELMIYETIVSDLKRLNNMLGDVK